MFMSDDEIRSSYRDAARPRDQIKVLAELNDVTEAEMRQKLEELGCKVEKKRGRKPGSKPTGKPAEPIDELRAMELWQEGLCDLDIAEALGVMEWKIRKWRQRMRLKMNKKGMPAEADGREEPTVPTETELSAAVIAADQAVAEIEEEKDMKNEEDRFKQEGQNIPADGEAPEYMTATVLKSILDRLTEGYPKAEVLVDCDAGFIRGANVIVSYSSTGTVDEVVLNLHG